jgi:hypothetical protein
MAAWEENFDAMQKNIENEARRSAERRAALTPRRRFRAELEHAAQQRNLRRGNRGHAATRAANRAVEAQRKRLMANYISRRPNFRSLASLRATSKKPLEHELPTNVVSHIESMLYGPRERGQGPIQAEMARRGRAHRIAVATRRHFPKSGQPEWPRHRSLPPKKRTRNQETRRKRSRPRST